MQPTAKSGGKHAGWVAILAVVGLVFISITMAMGIRMLRAPSSGPRTVTVPGMRPWLHQSDTVTYRVPYLAQLDTTALGCSYILLVEHGIVRNVHGGCGGMWQYFSCNVLPKEAQQLGRENADLCFLCKLYRYACVTWVYQYYSGTGGVNTA